MLRISKAETTAPSGHLLPEVDVFLLIELPIHLCGTYINTLRHVTDVLHRQKSHHANSQGKRLFKNQWKAMKLYTLEVNVRR